MSSEKAKSGFKIQVFWIQISDHKLSPSYSAHTHTHTHTHTQTCSTRGHVHLASLKGRMYLSFFSLSFCRMYLIAHKLTLPSPPFAFISIPLFVFSLSLLITCLFHSSTSFPFCYSFHGSAWALFLTINICFGIVTDLFFISWLVGLQSSSILFP